MPRDGPQDEATSDLVNRLRDDVLPPVEDAAGVKVAVTGIVAANIDFSGILSDRLPLFFLAVLALSFLLLMAVFRSLLVPLKAVIMNLLSIGAAYGIAVALFQWGWLSDLTGVQPGPIEPWVPMMLFAVVFGLSMDYEVFLLSRVREEWHRTGDSHTSVADGLAATAKVITAAAAIMVVVFGAFMLENERTMKLMGTGLATAIFLDATIVRMLLVPATMELLGDRNWWLPKWLDRILPNIAVEGTSAAAPLDDQDPEVRVPQDAYRRVTPRDRRMTASPPRSPRSRRSRPRAPRSRPADWAVFAAISTIWGASFLFIAVGLESLQPGVITLLRVGLGAAILHVLPGKRAPHRAGGPRPHAGRVVPMGGPALLAVPDRRAAHQLGHHGPAQRGHAHVHRAVRCAAVRPPDQRRPAARRLRRLRRHRPDQPSEPRRGLGGGVGRGPRPARHLLLRRGHPHRRAAPGHGTARGP